MKAIITAITVFIIGLMPMQLSAADFLFQVPVILDKIPKGIPQAKVVCEVFSYRDSQTPIATGYTIKAINLRDGNLHEEVDVSVNFLSQYRHLHPHQYHCKLFLLTPWAIPTWQKPGSDSDITALNPRANSQPVVEVSGLIR